MQNLFSKKISILIIILVTFLSVIPLFHAGFYPTHDGEYHVIRFYEFFKGITNNFYPRWAPDLNNGYGVPLFNYVYPLPNFISALLHVFGIGFIDAFKLEMVLASLIGGVSMYFLARHFWGEYGGIVASVLYTYSPYHFVDIYVRGSIGEVWALALFPLYLFLISEYYKNGKRVFFISSTIVFSLIIFAHNILSLMFLPFAISFVLFISIYYKKNSLDAFLSLIIGISIASIFFIPAILEKNYVVGLEIYNPIDNFVELYELIIPSWGTTFQKSDLFNHMSYQIGIWNLLAVFFSFAWILKRKIKREYVLQIFICIWFFISVFFMLSISKYLWINLPFINYFQFPWRLLSLSIFTSSFLSGFIVYMYKSKIVSLLLVTLFILTTISYTVPAYYFDRNDQYYTSRSNFIDGTNSVGNAFNTKWMSNSLPKKRSEAQIESGKGKVRLIKSTPYQRIVEINALSQVKLQFNIAYFPGWMLSIDGKKENIVPNKYGIVSASIPKGKHILGVELQMTLVQKIATFITCLGFLIVLFYFQIKAFFLKLVKSWLR